MLACHHQPWQLQPSETQWQCPQNWVWNTCFHHHLWLLQHPCLHKRWTQIETWVLLDALWDVAWHLHKLCIWPGVHFPPTQQVPCLPSRSLSESEAWGVQTDGASAWWLCACAVGAFSTVPCASVHPWFLAAQAGQVLGTLVQLGSAVPGQLNHPWVVLACLQTRGPNPPHHLRLLHQQNRYVQNCTNTFLLTSCKAVQACQFSWNLQSILGWHVTGPKSGSPPEARLQRGLPGRRSNHHVLTCKYHGSHGNHDVGKTQPLHSYSSLIQPKDLPTSPNDQSWKRRQQSNQVVFGKPFQSASCVSLSNPPGCPGSQLHHGFSRANCNPQNNHVSWVQWGMAHQRCQNPVLYIHDGQPCNKRLFFTLLHSTARDSTVNAVHCFHHRWATPLHIVVFTLWRRWQNDLSARWLHSQLLCELLRWVQGTSWVVTYIIGQLQGAYNTFIGNLSLGVLLNWGVFSITWQLNTKHCFWTFHSRVLCCVPCFWRVMDVLLMLFRLHLTITRLIVLWIIWMMSFFTITGVTSEIIVNLLGECVTGHKHHDPRLGFLVPCWGVSANLSNSGQGPLPCHVVKRSDSPWHFTLHQLCAELKRSRVFSQDDDLDVGLMVGVLQSCALSGWRVRPREVGTNPPQTPGFESPSLVLGKVQLVQQLHRRLSNLNSSVPCVGGLPQHRELPMGRPAVFCVSAVSAVPGLLRPIALALRAASVRRWYRRRPRKWGSTSEFGPRRCWCPRPSLPSTSRISRIAPWSPAASGIGPRTPPASAGCFLLLFPSQLIELLLHLFHCLEKRVRRSWFHRLFRTTGTGAWSPWRSITKPRKIPPGRSPAEPGAARRTGVLDRIVIDFLSSRCGGGGGFGGGCLYSTPAVGVGFVLTVRTGTIDFIVVCGPIQEVCQTLARWLLLLSQ